tara:strand:- start:5042 stop:8002 length:2961 start_codon:yes stop_codon:yes gene_type:complete
MNKKYLSSAVFLLTATAAMAADSLELAGAVSGLYEVQRWSLDDPANPKTMDPNNNNVYGEDGYIWFGTDGTAAAGSGGTVTSGTAIAATMGAAINYMDLPSYVVGMATTSDLEIYGGPAGASATRNNPSSEGDVMTVGDLGFYVASAGFMDILSITLDPGRYRIGFVTDFVTDFVNTSDQYEFNLYNPALGSIPGSAAGRITIDGDPDIQFFDIDISVQSTFSLAALNGDGDAIDGGLAGITFDPLPLATPFPEVAGPEMPNLIPNGSFDQVDSQNPAVGGVQVWNINGSYGDFLDFENRTANVTGWAPYKEDTNLLADLVGTEHLVTGDSGDLNGTFYLDTLWTDGEAIVMNSAMSYGNGMVQEDILSGVTIDPALTYTFSVSFNSGSDTSLSTFTAALTFGVDATNTASSAANNALIEVVGDYPAAVEPIETLVNGADLSGQVNVLFKHINASVIPNFPVIAPEDVGNDLLNTQVAIFDVSLSEVYVAAAGDVNKDGVVDDLDVALANSYLDGSIDSGDDAATRQGLLSPSMTDAEVLAYLNLTEFDLDGDGFFDAADAAAIDVLATAMILQIAGGGATLDFVWNSRTAKQYDLQSTASLASPISWLVYNDGVETYEDIQASGTGTNTLSGVLPDGSDRFFRLVEEVSQFLFITTNEAGFEDYTSAPSTMNAVWNATVNGAYSIIHEDFGAPDSHFPADGAAEGDYYVMMREAGMISQDLGTFVDAGDTVSVSFDVGRAFGQYDGGAGTKTGVMTCTLKVGASSNVVTIDTATLVADSWQTFANTWVSTESGPLSIEFAYVSGFGPFLDNISDVTILPTLNLIVQEPSFEDYTNPNQNMNAVWNPTGGGGYSVIREDFGAPDSHFPASGAADGDFFALMRDVGTISQDLGPVDTGDTLTVTFDVGRALGQYDGTGTGVMTCTLKVGASSNVVTIDTATLGQDTWQTFTNTWVSSETGMLSIEFAFVSGLGPFLDNISSVERVAP